MVIVIPSSVTFIFLKVPSKSALTAFSFLQSIEPSDAIVVLVDVSVNRLPLILTDLLPLILIVPLALSVISSAIASIADLSSPVVGSFLMYASRLADVA